MKQRPTDPRPPFLLSQELIGQLDALSYRGVPLPDESIGHALGKAAERLKHRPFASPAHFRNFVRQGALWHSRGEWRQRQRFPTRPLSPEHGGAAPRTHPADRWSPEEQAQLWLCLQRLPSLERRLLECHFYDGLSDARTAEVLFGPSANRSAAGLRVFRMRHAALRRLEVLLRGEGMGR